MSTTLVSARVDTMLVEQVRRSLEAVGLTISDLIRDAFSKVVTSGELPVQKESWYDAEKARKAAETTAYLESLPQGDPIPGWGDVEVDKQILGEWRMERFGEGL